MIKFIGYGKLLKRLFFTLLISCFILLGSFFVSALDLIPIGQTSILAGGNICRITSNLGISCSSTSNIMSSLDSDYSRSFVNVFWSSDGIGVYYNKLNGSSYQGIVKDGFFICEGNYNNLLNLGNLSYNDCPSGFNKIGIGNYHALINKLKNSTPLYRINLNTYAYGSAIIIVYQDFYFNFTVEGYGGQIGNGNLTSQNMFFGGTGFDTLFYNSSYVFNSPFGGGNIGGSSNVGENVILTGNVMYNSCTVGYIVSQVASEYGGINNVCYAGTNDTGFIQGGPTRVPVAQGLNFKEVYSGSINTPINGAYPYYSSYSDWFVSNSDLMYRWKMGQIAFPFEGYPVYLYAYFARLYDNGAVYPGNSWEAFRIANFCKLAVYGDYNSEYNGTYFSEYCDNLNHSSNNGINNNGGSNVTTGEVGSIDNDNEEILPPGIDIGGGNNQGSNTSSGIIVSVDWSGTLSGDTNKNFEGKTFINDFYQKLQSNFQKPYNGLVGIVPTYILVFMLALILFRFLSH